MCVSYCMCGMQCLCGQNCACAFHAFVFSRTPPFMLPAAPRCYPDSQPSLLACPSCVTCPVSVTYTVLFRTCAGHRHHSPKVLPLACTQPTCSPAPRSHHSAARRRSQPASDQEIACDTYWTSTHELRARNTSNRQLARRHQCSTVQAPR